MEKNFSIIKLISLIIFIISIANGCSAIKETSKFQIETGLYKLRNTANNRFYIVVDEDKLSLHPAVKTREGWFADSSITTAVYMKSVNSGAIIAPVTFVVPSFDIDVVSILFKYRPSSSQFPNQLNTNFNAAGYVGYRSDIYILSYDKNPLNIYQRKINHFGYSLGFFGGLGATSMNPFVTNNQIGSEYDGVVITNGIAALIAIGNFTFGTGLGFDYLMDKNHKTWIYQAKPWIGFTIGLNLN